MTYFKNQTVLPALTEIREIAHRLACQYATSQAYQRALQSPREEHSNDVPVDISTKDDFQGDWALANSILLIRDGILFLEACGAVAGGDTGRVWEVLKVNNHEFTQGRI